MRQPQVIYADELTRDWPETEVPMHGYVKSRPWPKSGDWVQRLRLAWAVFTGRMDALQWNKQ